MDAFSLLKTLGYTVKLSQNGEQFYQNVFKNDSLVIGRDENCDLNIQSASVSRRHFRLDVEDDKIFISDLGSSNGTSVDGIQISEKVQISSRSIIKAGRITIQIVFPEAQL